MVTSEFNPESDEIDVGDVDQRDNVVKRRLLTTEELVAQCLLFLLAGYETTSTTLAYIMYEMSVNPEAQKKLQEEIDEHFPENVSWNGCYDICSIITFLYWPTCSWLDFNTLFLYLRFKIFILSGGQSKLWPNSENGVSGHGLVWNPSEIPSS